MREGLVYEGGISDVGYGKRHSPGVGVTVANMASGSTRDTSIFLAFRSSGPETSLLARLLVPTAQ